MNNLKRTAAAAVTEYDRVNTLYRRVSNDKTLEEVEEALQKVKEAFAADTADINCRDNAMLVTPDSDNGWLRKLLVKEGYKDCGLTKEVRLKRGWGW